MALAILVSLVGYSVAVKIIAVCKMLGIKIENYTEQDFLKLLEKPEFRKYMR